MSYISEAYKNLNDTKTSITNSLLFSEDRENKIKKAQQDLLKSKNKVIESQQNLEEAKNAVQDLDKIPHIYFVRKTNTGLKNYYDVDGILI
jgi:uncharacterized protein